jgi:hypothetical protein
MYKLDLLLSHFEDVRKSGKEYMCKCPAHEDKTASLTVTEKDTDHIYLHCFAGCETIDILQSVGLDWDALFPDSKKRSRKPQISVREAALLLQYHGWVVFHYANMIAMGEDPDRDALAKAVFKISEVNNLLEGIE